MHMLARSITDTYRCMYTQACSITCIQCCTHLQTKDNLHGSASSQEGDQRVPDESNIHNEKKANEEYRTQVKLPSDDRTALHLVGEEWQREWWVGEREKEYDRKEEGRHTEKVMKCLMAGAELSQRSRSYTCKELHVQTDRVHQVSASPTHRGRHKKEKQFL